MDIGIFARLLSSIADADYLQRVASEVERLGVSTLWLGEHVVVFDEYDSQYPGTPGKKHSPNIHRMLDLVASLGFLAASTSTVRLGSGVCLLPQNNPVYVAKQYATLNHLSGGRLNFGVGVGWSWEEYDALNASFEHRGRRCDEYLEVIASLWYDELSEYDGEFYRLPPCRCYPKPGSRIPVTVGGWSDVALRRVSRFGDAWYGLNLSVEEVSAAISTLQGYLGTAGRRLEEVRVIIGTTFDPIPLSDVEGYANVGVDELVLPLAGDPAAGELSPILDHVPPYLEEVKRLRK